MGFRLLGQICKICEREARNRAELCKTAKVSSLAALFNAVIPVQKNKSGCSNENTFITSQFLVNLLCIFLILHNREGLKYNSRFLVFGKVERLWLGTLRLGLHL